MLWATRLPGHDEPVADSVACCDEFEAGLPRLSKLVAPWYERPGRPSHLRKDTTMPELLVDFITSLDEYASGEGWPGFWVLRGLSTSPGWASNPKSRT